jgi:ADP-ribosylglycohydrolase
MRKHYIIGAIAGDIIGSSYEFQNVKTTDFDLFPRGTFFTDDSTLTMATMSALLGDSDYTRAYQQFGRRFPRRGYGGTFKRWIHSKDPQPYNSWGNGSAMRASPVGWYGKTLDDVMAEAKKSAEVTHNHPEGIKGAQATAAAVFLARTGQSKDAIREYISKTFAYNLDRTVADIRPNYEFDVSCQGSVPEAIIAFLESTDFENAVRLAVSLGGDSDTIGCITGGIAEAFYKKIPENIADMVSLVVGPDMMKDVVIPFSDYYGMDDYTDDSVPYGAIVKE